MARRAKRPAPRAAAASRSSSAADTAPRQRIIEAFMALLAEEAFERIGLGDVAERAEVSLADLRNEFGSTLAILAAHVKELDRQVLASVDPDLADETPRERLFDVLMRRLELMAPHKEAIRSLMRSVRRDPPLALALNGLAVCSQQWMLTAAGIGATGPKGMIRAQGLALLYANVLRTWIDDDDEGLARTLAALDRELARGQRLVGLLDELCKIPERACRLTRRVRRPRRGDDEREERVAM
jgi:AcrR family transcriptional regulator